MMRKVLALVLALVLLAAGLPLSSSAAPSFLYEDVKPTSWYAYAVEWATRQGVVSGVGDGRFAPKSPVTRPQLMQMLFQLAGSPEAAVQAFTDVDQTRWYAKAVNWAGAAGVTAGYPDGTFGVGRSATRQEVVSFLFRYAALQGMDVSARADLSAFTDADQISAYALEAMQWAVAVGILSGTTPTTLSPRDVATRAQLVSMLYHWLADFTQKDYPLYRYGLETSETVTLRYYPDQPHVPTMGLLDYYNSFQHLRTTWPEATMARQIDGTFLFTTSSGCAVQVDPEADTMVIPNLTLFQALPPATAPVEVEGNPTPFIFAEEIRYDPAETLPVTLDFSRYGIDLKADLDDVFLPLNTLADLFTGNVAYFPMFNGKAVYMADNFGNVDPNCPANSAPDYYDFLDEPRSADLIDYTYRELLFNLETFYGQPSGAKLNDALTSHTLDQLLQNDYPEVYACLQDPNPVRFGLGLFSLFNCLLDDGGHTGFINYIWGGVSYGEAMLEAAQQMGLTYQGRYLENSSVYQNLAALQTQALGGSNYREEGDTALFAIPSFTIDTEAWHAYYTALERGETPQLPTGDTLSEFLAAVERAQANPQIRNFVVDLSTCGGGIVQVGAFIADLISDGTLYFRSSVTGQRSTTHYRYDRNLDGVDDERDREVHYDLNFAVLISRLSFSFANTFPTMLKDQGILLLGETTGGGSCQLSYNATPEGFFYFISSSTKTCTQAGEDADSGAVPHLNLVATDDQGNPDYSSYYDFELLSRVINDYYAQANTQALDLAA